MKRKRSAVQEERGTGRFGQVIPVYALNTADSEHGNILEASRDVSDRSSTPSNPSRPLSWASQTSELTTPSKISHRPPTPTRNLPRNTGCKKDYPIIIRSSQDDHDEEANGSDYGPLRHREADDSLDTWRSDAVDPSSPHDSLEDMHNALFQQKPQTASETVNLEVLEQNQDMSSAVTPTTTYKFCLHSLVKQNKRDSTAQLEVASARAALRSSSPDIEGCKSPLRSHPEEQLTSIADEHLLLSVMPSEREDQAGRVLQAMSRNDMLKSESKWHFFGEENETVGTVRLEFPVLESQLSTWMTARYKSNTWGHDLSTGFALERLSRSRLPEVLLTWMLAEAFSEPNNELANAYLAILKSCKDSLRGYLQPERLQNLFERVGCRSEAADINQPIVPFYRPNGHQRRGAHLFVSRLVDAFAWLSGSLSMPSTTYALSILIRLSIDHDTFMNAKFQTKLQKVVAALVDTLPESEADQALLEVSSNTMSCVKHPSFRHRLVSSISDLSPRLSMMKRRLALAFFLEDPDVLHSSLDSSANLPERIVRHLHTSSQFDLNSPNIDYSKVSALISLLDIGIAGGFSAFQSKEDEAAFNADIDAISTQVNAFFTRITDSGASYMARTEAKCTLELLLRRLDYGVRTRPRPNNKAFVALLERRGVAVVEPGQQRFMAKFLKGRAESPGISTGQEEQETEME